MKKLKNGDLSGYYCWTKKCHNIRKKLKRNKLDIEARKKALRFENRMSKRTECKILGKY